MATRTYKNTYADGHVEHVEYEVNTPSDAENEEITAEEALSILLGVVE